MSHPHDEFYESPGSGSDFGNRNHPHDEFYETNRPVYKPKGPFVPKTNISDPIDLSPASLKADAQAAKQKYLSDRNSALNVFKRQIREEVIKAIHSGRDFAKFDIPKTVTPEVLGDAISWITQAGGRAVHDKHDDQRDSWNCLEIHVNGLLV